MLYTEKQSRILVSKKYIVNIYNVIRIMVFCWLSLKLCMHLYLNELMTSH